MELDGDEDQFTIFRAAFDSKRTSSQQAFSGIALSILLKDDEALMTSSPDESAWVVSLTPPNHRRRVDGFDRQFVADLARGQSGKFAVLNSFRGIGLVDLGTLKCNWVDIPFASEHEGFWDVAVDEKRNRVVVSHKHGIEAMDIKSFRMRPLQRFKTDEAREAPWLSRYGNQSLIHRSNSDLVLVKLGDDGLSATRTLCKIDAEITAAFVNDDDDGIVLAIKDRGIWMNETALARAAKASASAKMVPSSER